jgi:hypothetical protein
VFGGTVWELTSRSDFTRVASPFSEAAQVHVWLHDCRTQFEKLAAARGEESWRATVYGPRKFEDMDRDDRVRACYQHCALKWVMSERMTNQTLRERFRLPESKSAIVSQVIGAAIDSGLVKPDEAVGGSRKYARYLPFWA